MSDAPLVPAPVYGLRAWRVASGERLAGTQQDATWPAGGAWLEASCAHARGHARAARRRARTTALRLAAAALVIAALVGAGLAATDDPGKRTLFGRTGEVHR